MRLPHDQETLNSMTDAQKYTATSPAEFKKRGTFVFDYEDWYLTKNEFPHNGDREDEMVLWFKRKKLSKNFQRGFFEAVVEWTQKGYRVVFHGKDEMSVPFRPHCHIYRIKK